MAKSQPRRLIFSERELNEMHCRESKTYLCSDTKRRITLYRANVLTYDLWVQDSSRRVGVSCSRSDINAVALCFLTGSFR